jgi:hypothetical protein
MCHGCELEFGECKLLHYNHGYKSLVQNTLGFMHAFGDDVGCNLHIPFCPKY